MLRRFLPRPQQRGLTFDQMIRSGSRRTQRTAALVALSGTRTKSRTSWHRAAVHATATTSSEQGASMEPANTILAGPLDQVNYLGRLPRPGYCLGRLLRPGTRLDCPACVVRSLTIRCFVKNPTSTPAQDRYVRVLGAAAVPHASVFVKTPARSPCGLDGIGS